MIFTGRSLKVTVRTPQDPLREFLERQDAIGSLRCCVSFTRYIGVKAGETDAAYRERICAVDRYCAEHAIAYCRVTKWKVLDDFSQVQLFSEQYSRWENERRQGFKELPAFPFPVRLSDDGLDWTQKKAFQQVFALYTQSESQLNDAKQKNFFVKFFGWMYQYLPQLYRGQKNFPKVVFYGDIKLHEYLFLYFLALLGCDVLYVHAVRDMVLPEQLLRLSAVYRESAALAVLPSLSPDRYITGLCGEKVAATEKPAALAVASSMATGIVDIARPPRGNQTPPLADGRRELDYEALAQLAISVVKIKVYDEKKEVLCTGSGVVFHPNGYIVTNLHVVSGGESYGIQYENETKEYYAEALVKCHQIYDLAVLKADRRSSPLPIYDGALPLKRGQKIVAIGSPLGLFNSISDGIISGFRELDDRSMIQFTAPISPGSSGGALLDLQGNLIGVITCHFIEGQNLNLAVDFVALRSFLGNLLPPS